MMLTVVLTTCYAHAQVTLGARAGLNFINISNTWDGEKVSSNALPGFQLGLIADYQFNERISFLPGLVFSNLAAKIKQDGGTMQSRINYIQTPLDVQYKIDLDGPKFFVQAGPYLGCAINGKYKIKSGGISGSEKMTFGRGDSGVKRLDMGIGAGIGLEYSNMQVAFGYSIGLMNLSNVNNYNTKNKGFWLTLNYFFL